MHEDANDHGFIGKIYRSKNLINNFVASLGKRYEQYVFHKIDEYECKVQGNEGHHFRATGDWSADDWLATASTQANL